MYYIYNINIIVIIRNLRGRVKKPILLIVICKDCKACKVSFMGRPVCVYKIKITIPFFVRNFILPNGENVIVIITFAKIE